MPPLLYMVRHGQTDWNVEERLQGQADTDINAAGRAQADRNGARLAAEIGDPSAFDFVASPLGRTRETMERVRLAMGMPAEGYRTDARLLEVHFGDWQGFTYEELEARAPGCTKARNHDKWNFLPPGTEAESYAILAKRVKPWLDALDRPTVCICHGGVMRVVFRWLEDLAPARAAGLDIPQDRILRVREGRFDWL